jgi:hypothetical protein
MESLWFVQIGQFVHRDNALPVYSRGDGVFPKQLLHNGLKNAWRHLQNHSINNKGIIILNSLRILEAVMFIKAKVGWSRDKTDPSCTAYFINRLLCCGKIF